MAAGDDLVQLLGDQTFKALGQRATSLGLKVGRMAAPAAYEEYDASEAMEFTGSGFRTTVLLPKAGERMEGLNLTPFISNVGTYLRQQGVPLGSVSEFTLNAVLDIGNLIPLGTATKLTRAGEAAAVISAVSKGGKIKGGAEVIDATREILETAWKASGAGKELLIAAEAGERGALKAILTRAIKSGTLDAEQEAILGTLKARRSGLGNLLKHADEIRAQKALGPSYFLQGTRAERLAAGQVNPLIGVAKVANPFRHPGTFARQMLGFHYGGEDFFEPIPRGFMAAMDRIAKPALMYDLPTELKFSTLEKAETAFNEAAKATGGFTTLHLRAALEPMRAVLSSPNDRALLEMTEGAIDDEGAKALFREAHSLKRGAEIDDAGDFAAFKHRLLNDAVFAQRQKDSVRMQARTRILDAALGRVGGLADAEVAAGRIDEAQALAFKAHVRTFYDAFSLDSLKLDANGFGHGLAARSTVGTLYAHTTGSIAREIIRQAAPGSGLGAGRARRQLGELVARAVEHPEMFEVGGRLKLTADDKAIKEGSPLLDELLFGPESDGKLVAKLRGEGFGPEVADMVSAYRETLTDIGTNFIENESILVGLMADYFPRVFTPTKKFYDEFKLSHATAGKAYERALSDPDVARLLLGEADERRAWDDLVARAAQGKVTMMEARRATEAQMLRMERLGYGRYSRDAVGLFSGYMDSANKALLMNRMVSDLPQIAPFLTRQDLEGKIPAALLASKTDEEINAIRRFARAGDVPGWATPAFVDVFPKYATRADEPSLKLGARSVTAKAFVSGEVEANVRRALAEKANGRTRIGQFRLRDAKTGKPMKADPEWFRTGVVSPKVKFAPAVTKEIERLVAEGVGKARVGSAKAIKKFGEPKATGRTLVFTADAGPIQEAFRLYKQDGMDGKVLRTFEAWNAGLKAAVLWGDFFHFNTLAVTSVAGDPASFIKAFAEDAAALPAALKGGFAEGVENTVVRAALGSIAGLGVGGLLGADTYEEYGTFSLAGFLWGGAIGAAMKNARSARRLAMNPHNLDNLLWMGLGGWTGRPDDRSIGIAQRWLRTKATELWGSSNQGARLLIHPIEGTAHLMDGWDRILWETLHNGGKQYYFDTIWRQQLPKLEASAHFKGLKTEAARWQAKRALATEIVQASNNAFGGQAYRHLFSQPEWERAARWIMISPDWSLSRLQLGAAFFGNMTPVKAGLMGAGLGTMMEAADRGYDTDAMDGRGVFFGVPAGLALGAWGRGVNKRMLAKGDVYAKLSRNMAGAALLGGYAIYNLMNFAMNGRWMWQNDEGEKLSVVVGDTGVRLTPGKVFTEPWEYAAIKDADIYPWPVVSRFSSKLSVPLMAGIRVATNREYFGGPIIMPRETPWAVAGKTAELALSFVTPLGLERAGRLGGDLLGGDVPPMQQVGRAITDIGGFPLRGRGRPEPYRAPGLLPSLLPPPPAIGNPSLLESNF